MIPERISVRGFLCYRDPQEVCFEGCSLWMLAGPNGSGKSALFDAMTFALYGQHRAGKYNARELINKRSDGLVIEIDFRLDRDLFRARRTLDRAGRPTRQLYAWSGPERAGEESRWREIADTHTEQGFDRWIRDHVGLTYDMFTASVLLLQGKADNLLQVGPAERHNLLTQIVGLERYQQIHAQAERHGAEARGAAEHLRRQLAVLPVVPRAELQDAQRAMEDAATEGRTLAAAVEQLTECIREAERWQALVDRQTRLQQQIARLRRALADEQAIERDYQRWVFLEEHLDHLTAWSQHRQAWQAGQAELTGLLQTQRDLQQAQLGLDQQAHEVCEALQAAEEELENVSALDQQLAARQTHFLVARSSLERLQRERSRLQRAESSAAALQRRLDRLVAHRRRVAASPPPDDTVLTARDALAAARDEQLRRRTVGDLTEERWQRFHSVVGRPTCPYCQQTLSAEYACQLQQKMEFDRADAHRLYAHAERELITAQTRLDGCQRLASRRQALLERIETRIQSQTLALEMARRSAQESRAVCAEAIGELPDIVRQQTTSLLIEGADETTGAERLGSVDQELADLQQRRAQLATNAGRCRATLRLLRVQQNDQASGRHLRSAENTRLVERTAEVRSRCIYHERMCQEYRVKLPVQWQVAGEQDVPEAVEALERERSALAAPDITSQYQTLQIARSEIEQQTLELHTVEESLDRIVPQARRPANELLGLLDESRRKRAAAEDAQRSAAGKAGSLEERLRQRRSLLADLKQAERQRHLWGRLVPLLGREGLQYYLLERAEQAIVEHANAILDRLAAGQVHIQLREQQRRKGGVRRALDLVAFTATSGPRLQDIAFLSGSQRFRLAVALSLAIGQYASRSRRPVQAVIIDEGFGCLDSTNRQVMIQELQNLRSQLQRIVLVSHQEEFISAFADGYQCELVDGATRLTPFHR